MRADFHFGVIIGFLLLFLLIVPSVSAVNLADQYYNEGLNFSANGKYADAVAAYDKVVFIQPGNADAWDNRGIALENLGRYSEAVSSYDKAIALQPGFAEAWYNRGVSFRKMGKYADAVASYDKAVTINPTFAEAWLNRGVALDYLGRNEESIASYDKALEIQPNFTAAQENRELALSKKDRVNPAMIGTIVILVIIVMGVVLWQLKSKRDMEKAPDEIKPDLIIIEEKRPEERLGYGTIPDAGELHTLASLCAVINMNGRSILEDPNKVAALLDEMSKGDYQRERNALIIGMKDNVPQELLKPQKGFTWVSTSSRLKKQLIEKHGMSDDLAGWVIETWAKALEMVT